MKGIELFSKQDIKPMAWWLHTDIDKYSDKIDSLIKDGESCVNIYASYQAWLRDNFKYMKKLKAMVDICENKNIKVILTLFRRKTGYMANDGELTLDMILPNLCWAYKKAFFSQYFLDLARYLEDNKNILYWDVVDYPVYKDIPQDIREYMKDREYRLARTMVFSLRSCGVDEPVGCLISLDEKDLMPEGFGELCQYTTWLTEDEIIVKEGYDFSAKTICTMKKRR